MNYVPLDPKELQDLMSETTEEALTIEDTNITTQTSLDEKLISLNRNKAPCPDGIPKWILKEYAELLTNPISNMLNASYHEMKLPLACKQANVPPLAKEKLIRDTNEHLRPISLTSAISKQAEDFVVEQYVSPAIMEVIDPHQFGGVSRSSATQVDINTPILAHSILGRGHLLQHSILGCGHTRHSDHSK